MKSNLRLTKLSVCLLSALLWTSHQLAAQEQEWWFDIELIVFERVQSEPLAEQFDPVAAVPNDYQLNLFNNALYPDISLLVQNLPECEIPEPLPTVASIIERHQLWLEQQQQAAQARLDALTGAGDILSESQYTTDSAQLESVNFLDGETIEPQTVEQDSELSALEQTSSATAEISPAQNVLTTQEEGSSFDENSLDLVPSFTERQQTFIERLAPIEPWEVERRVDCVVASDYLRAEGLTLQNVDDTLPRVERVTKDLGGESWFRADFAHLLPQSERKMDEFARDIERLRNHNILLHTVWRQEVQFGRDVAEGVRLIAGTDWHKPLHDARLAQDKLDEQTASMSNDYTAELDETLAPLLGSEIEPGETADQEDEFFEQLNIQLQQPVTETLINEILFGEEQNSDTENELETPLWQVDGVFKVYLQYINRVPYLHIDNDLVIHTPTKTDTRAVPIEFEGVQLKQLRRVISQQVHYFDHPLVGVIVQIRRHQRPDPIVQETDLSSK